jgi:phospholipid/cholesterol/gamma-HCH transport system substrate-binding protein
MKFKIRFADQIVGFFVLLSIVALVFVIIMLGRSQRWFADDVSYKTVLPTAGKKKKNMAVQFKGFTIGHIKSFYLTENDNVEVIFVIHEGYVSRVKQGSMVELIESPIGLGNQFVFHAGLGANLEEGSFVPIAGSAQAKELIRQGLAEESKQADSITAILKLVNAILEDVSTALGDGSSTTEIGRIVGSLGSAMSDVGDTTSALAELIGDAQAQLGPILKNLNALTAELNKPDGLIYSVLDTDKDVYKNLVSLLSSASAILGNLERTTDFIPAQLPQLAGLIMDLRETMKTVEDVLTALANNPLLRRGVPERPESQNAGTGPRGIPF